MVKPYAFPVLCLHRLCIHIPTKTKQTRERGASTVPQENVVAVGRTESHHGWKEHSLTATQDSAMHVYREDRNWSSFFLIIVCGFFRKHALHIRSRIFEKDICGIRETSKAERKSIRKKHRVGRGAKGLCSTCWMVGTTILLAQVSTSQLGHGEGPACLFQWACMSEGWH